MDPIPDSIVFKPSTSKTIIFLFVALELSGAFGMMLILFSAILSQQVKRLATWYTFCLSWTISCLSYLLLFFSGEIHSPEPPKAICITQAALIYSVPTLTASTTLSLLIHSWYNVHFGLSKPPLESNPRVVLALLLAPFALWILLLSGFLVFGIKAPSLVHNFGLYCTFMELLPSKISSLFVIITTFSTIPIQASLGISLFRDFDRNDASSAISVQTVKMVVRVFTFSFLILIGFAEALIHLLTLYRNTAVDIILALLPVFGVLIFGIQQDLFQLWFSWTGISLCFPYLYSATAPRTMASSTSAIPSLRGKERI
ncbi:hypothetical protein BT96DRAFT_921220 [Gymnopus androsaceus JB14]|uniref:G-protein coupled receptors family 1 profile domain-containing protein n=1 Tax=Gymnopus androsaceus JB14 TaxID=1447944 RepID=A0A6A4HJ93_9AGAR|nr:hypothetical protein BT96DRAFT_921220 [Gymnopus androsaceus JB14]